MVCSFTLVKDMVINSRNRKLYSFTLELMLAKVRNYKTFKRKPVEIVVWMVRRSESGARMTMIWKLLDISKYFCVTR